MWIFVQSQLHTVALNFFGFSQIFFVAWSIDKNHLKFIPPEIGNLSNLQFLDLRKYICCRLFLLQNNLGINGISLVISSLHRQQHSSFPPSWYWKSLKFAKAVVWWAYTIVFSACRVLSCSPISQFCSCVVRCWCTIARWDYIALQFCINFLWELFLIQFAIGLTFLGGPPSFILYTYIEMYISEGSDCYFFSEALFSYSLIMMGFATVLTTQQLQAICLLQLST